METIVINGKTFKAYDDMYYVSADGQIYSTYRHKCLKWAIDHNGYPRVDIHQKHIKVHKLVYLVWGSKDLQDKQINHKDDNKMNPHIDNLYLGSQKENIKDCCDNGTRVGNTNYLTIYDKETDEILSFTPITKFIEYCGHPAQNGSVKRMFTRNWFKKRYDILNYCNVAGVTTNPDECKDVGQILVTARSVPL